MKSFLKIDSGYEFKFRHFICINSTFKILKLLESSLIDKKNAHKCAYRSTQW